MKIQYYPETDSLYIALRAGGGSDSREISEGIVVDFDADGRVVGFDIQHASKNLSMETLEAVGFPVKQLKVG